MFQLQKFSNYGTSTPAVARTLLQGLDILSVLQATDAQKEAVKGVLMDLQRNLLRCVEVVDRIKQDVPCGKTSVAKQGVVFQSQGQVTYLPGVPDVQASAESFLQSAKLAIRATAQLVEPFYDAKYDHRFDKFATWAEGKFGPRDPFAQSIRSWEPWVKRWVTMRNAVDHANDGPKGRLHVFNFRLCKTEHRSVLLEPAWCLSGEVESPLVADMSAFIEGCLQLGETVLVGIFCKLKPDFLPLVIHVIPEEKRDPTCPKRLRVCLPGQADA